LHASAIPLVVENLSFRYRARPDYALRHVSFQAAPGEIVLVAGASGCGKTTLIRCINGLIPRSYHGELSGRVLLYGKEMTSRPLSEISQIVGTVLQDPEKQILGSRVENEIAFGLENLGLPPEEILARVEETLKYLNIEHLRERETFYLSGGEKQKVAVAGTLAMHPSILLLDEPLASLDPVSAQEALRLIRRLADEGKTVLIIEHRVEDVLTIHPDKALFMMNGEVRYFGPVEGFQQVVDYREVKLPAPLILEKARRSPPLEPVLPPETKEDSPSLIEFEDVSFAYEDGPEVLHGINLTIRYGDVVALLGPNGAGKTTLAKHAIGLLKPKSGRVRVNGVDTREMSVAEAARAVGYVFQSPSHMLFAPTVRKELAFGPENLGYDQATINESVSRAVEILNLKDLEDYPPLSLSFGQQKRVSIAAILAMRSRVLVMDEPTAGQDYMNYMTFVESILRLREFDALLFITHDLDLAVCYANRVVLMREGTIVAGGPPTQVLARRDILEQCRIVPTSLLALNLQYLPKTGRFMRAELLAHAT